MEIAFVPGTRPAVISTQGKDMKIGIRRIQGDYLFGWPVSDSTEDDARLDLLVMDKSRHEFVRIPAPTREAAEALISLGGRTLFERYASRINLHPRPIRTDYQFLDDSADDEAYARFRQEFFDDGYPRLWSAIGYLVPLGMVAFMLYWLVYVGYLVVSGLFGE